MQGSFRVDGMRRRAQAHWSQHIFIFSYSAIFPVVGKRFKDRREHANGRALPVHAKTEEKGTQDGSIPEGNANTRLRQCPHSGADSRARLERASRLRTHSAIYYFVRDEILFGYNADDGIPALRVLADGFGQCNTKGTLFMALLRSCDIPCRVHGFLIDKKLQKGAMTGIVYYSAPQEVLHSWVEVLLDGRWYELEGFILDKGYLGNLQAAHPECTGAFCGYGVAVKDFQRPVVDFDRNDTYIQSEGITRDLGIYDCPDDLPQEHSQAMSAPKAFAYRHIGRHLMNQNVKKIRNA